MANIRKILSFDVGIINLAYCFLEINDDEQTFKINGWGVIDLADGRKKCSFTKRNKEACGKIAKHMVKIDDNNTQYYCNAHIVKAELDTRSVNVEWSAVSEKTKSA